MIKKIVVIINIMSCSLLLHGMEKKQSIKKPEQKFKLTLHQSDGSTGSTEEKNKLGKNNPGSPLVSAKDSKGSIRSLRDIQRLKSDRDEFRDKNVSPNRRDEVSDKK